MKAKLIIAFFAILVLASCTKPTVRSVERCIVKGEWYVSFYYANGLNYTSDYSSLYTFTFSKNGTVTVRNHENTVQGSWSVRRTNGDVHFNLSLKAPVDRLSNDWIVVDKSDDFLELRFDSSVGTADLLTFRKK
jgi:hypothetical protein